jgi:hypothetical protein
LAEKPISGGREIVEPLADTEVSGVVDGGLCAEGLALFVVLLDLGSLVVDVQRRGDAFSDHPGAEASRRAFGDAPFEDERHLVGTADVEVVADHLLEEDPSREGAVEHLGEGELGLRMETS